jgi:hypothetical protein
MSDAATRDAIRRRVAGWRAAELREIEQRRQEGPMDPDAALDAAEELAELLPEGTSVEDSVRAREVAEVRKAWAALRAHYSCRPNAPRR